MVAGRRGDKDAEIVALQMEPSQLRIADVSAFGPKGLAGAEIPEKAGLVTDSSGIDRMRYLTTLRVQCTT
jgi:septum site-determining protein MinC